MAESKFAQQLDEVNSKLGTVNRNLNQLDRMNRRILGATIAVRQAGGGGVPAATRGVGLTMSGGGPGGSSGGGKTLIVLGKIAQALDKIERNTAGVGLTMRTGRTE